MREVYWCHSILELFPNKATLMLVLSVDHKKQILKLIYIKIYIISSVMHAFWLILTYDLLEDRRIDDVIKTFFNSLLYKTNRFQVAMCLFSNRSQRTTKCGKNISDTLGCASCATSSSVIYYSTDAWQLGIYLLIQLLFCECQQVS